MNHGEQLTEFIECLEREAEAKFVVAKVSSIEQGGEGFTGYRLARSEAEEPCCELRVENGTGKVQLFTLRSRNGEWIMEQTIAKRDERGWELYGYGGTERENVKEAARKCIVMVTDFVEVP